MDYRDPGWTDYKNKGQLGTAEQCAALSDSQVNNSICYRDRTKNKATEKTTQSREMNDKTKVFHFLQSGVFMTVRYSNYETMGRFHCCIL